MQKEETKYTKGQRNGLNIRGEKGKKELQQ